MWRWWEIYPNPRVNRIQRNNVKLTYVTRYNQHHPKSKSRQNTAALSEITELTHRLFPAPLVKISVPLEGINFLVYLTTLFKSKWLPSSAGLSKIPAGNQCYNWLFLTVKVAPQTAEMFSDVSVARSEKERPLCEPLCFHSATVFSHLLSSAFLISTLQSSTSHPLWSPHASSLLPYILPFSLNDISGECSHHIISG